MLNLHDVVYESPILKPGKDVFIRQSIRQYHKNHGQAQLVHDTPGRMAAMSQLKNHNSKGLEDIKDLIISLDEKLDRRVDALDQKLDRRIDALDRKLDNRVDSLDQRIGHLDQRINHLDQRMSHLDQRIGHLDQKLSKYFLWIIGIQVTIFLSIIATLLR